MKTASSMKIVIANLAATATATALILSAGLNDTADIPSDNYAITNHADEKSWESYMQNPYSVVGDVETLNNIYVLHQFAAKIIENSVELDPTIAKIVSKNFSKLL